MSLRQHSTDSWRRDQCASCAPAGTACIEFSPKSESNVTFANCKAEVIWWRGLRSRTDLAIWSSGCWLRTSICVSTANIGYQRTYICYTFWRPSDVSRDGLFILLLSFIFYSYITHELSKSAQWRPGKSIWDVRSKVKVTAWCNGIKNWLNYQ